MYVQYTLIFKDNNFTNAISTAAQWLEDIQFSIKNQRW